MVVSEKNNYLIDIAFVLVSLFAIHIITPFIFIQYFSIDILNRWVDIFPFVFLLFITFYYVKNRWLRNKFYKPKKYLFPLYISASFSFGIISLLFGIHTDKFITYDGNQGDLNFTRWMNISEIVSFPVEQLSLKSTVPLQEITLSKSKILPKNRLDFIVLDRTESGSTDVSSYTNPTKLCEHINTTICRTFCYDESKCSLNVRDKLVPYIFCKIYHQNLSLNDSSDIGIFSYSGFTKGVDNVLTGGHYTESINYVDSLNFIERYSDRIKKFDSEIASNKKLRQPQETNLNCVINSITKILSTPDETKKYDEINLHLVSDFINSKPEANFKDTLKILYSDKRIKKINLYQIFGSDKEDILAKSATRFTDELKEIFKESAIVHPIDLRNPENASTISDLDLVNSRDNHEKLSSISFYYPFIDDLGNERVISKICFNEINNDIDIFNLKFFDINKDETWGNIQYKINSTFRTTSEINETAQLSINNDDTLSIEIGSPTVISNNRLLFEITPQSTELKKRYFIKLLPRIPSTTCFILLLSYSIFLFSIALILLLPTLFLLSLIYNKHILSNNWTRRILYVPIIESLILIVYYFIKIWDIQSVLSYSFLSFFLIIGISFPLFISAYKIKVVKLTDDPVKHHFTFIKGLRQVK